MSLQWLTQKKLYLCLCVCKIGPFLFATDNEFVSVTGLCRGGFSQACLTLKVSRYIDIDIIYPTKKLMIIFLFLLCLIGLSNSFGFCYPMSSVRKVIIRLS